MKIEMYLTPEQAVSLRNLLSDGDMLFTINDALDDQILDIKHFQEDYPDDCTEQEIDKMIKDIKDIQDTLLTCSEIRIEVK